MIFHVALTITSPSATPCNVNVPFDNTERMQSLVAPVDSNTFTDAVLVDRGRIRRGTSTPVPIVDAEHSTFTKFLKVAETCVSDVFQNRPEQVPVADEFQLIVTSV
jgi:hypothetical protein